MPRRKGRGKVDSCIVPFHACLNANLASNTFGIPLLPASFSRAAAEADTWAHFRVPSLSFRLLPTPSAGIMAAGYVGGVEDTPPATFNTISELIPSCFLGLGQTCPTNWIRVPRIDLAGPFPWYKSVAGAADPTEESPGALRLGGSGATDFFALEVKGTFEFKTAVSTANTPLAVRVRAQLREERRDAIVRRERDLLLQILSKASPAVLPDVKPFVSMSGSVTVRPGGGVVFNT